MTSEIRRVAPQLGIDPVRIRRVETLSERHGHRVCRLDTAERSYILKWFSDKTEAVEVAAYRLLSELGIPTLPVHGTTDQALLLEDLQASPDWRLATVDDLARPEMGCAVAGWYRELHERGRRLLSGGRPRPAFLRRESDRLDEAVILATGDALGLAEEPVWRLAADHIQLLRDAEARLDLTLSYNDFYWTNLALSRVGTLRAVVFDHHLLGIGVPTSDCRNVTSALGENAAVAFRETYGDTDPREEIICRPLATLFALFTATRRDDFPAWGKTASAGRPAAS